MAYPSVTYTFSNSTTADATQVNQNFTDLINGLSDGTKDLSISALTVAGTATLNGAINLGNATSDDITITGYLASSFIPKTNQTYDIGTADLGLRALYLGVASAGALTAKVIASASIAADRIFTVPEAGTDASFVMTAGTQTISGAKTFDTAGNAIKGIASGGTIASGYIGEKLEVTSTSIFTQSNAASGTYYDYTSMSLTLTPGVWRLSCNLPIEGVYSSGGAGSTIVAGAIRTGSTEVISGCVGLVGASVAEPMQTLFNTFSGSTIVNISASTTYKLSIKHNHYILTSNYNLHGRGDLYTCSLTATRIG